MILSENVASISTPNDNTSSGVESSGTVGTTRGTNDSQTDESIFAGEAVRRIETFVEAYRTGKVKKSQAIVQISKVLEAESGGSEQLKLDALERYTSTLDGIDARAAESNKHGEQITRASHGKGKDELNKRGRGHEESDRDIARVSQTIDVNDFLDRLSKGNEPGVEGNDGNHGRESGDESNPESEDAMGERGRSNKKQRIYESQMPWFETEQQFRRSNTNLSCNKTRRLLNIFQRDPATVKRWIRCASSAPAGFPSSEWDALIKGESVDIDSVFSSLHYIHRVDESVGHVGSTEIQFGRPKPAAKVETSGQWTAVFNLIVKATAFLFPHRYEELRQY